jgi:hypothetical protein
MDSSSSAEKETLKWCESLFREVKKNIPPPYQNTGGGIFVRLADICKDLIDGGDYNNYPAAEVDQLYRRASDLLVKTQNSFQVYYEALREFYEFFTAAGMMSVLSR